GDDVRSERRRDAGADAGARSQPRTDRAHPPAAHRGAHLRRAGGAWGRTDAGEGGAALLAGAGLHRRRTRGAPRDHPAGLRPPARTAAPRRALTCRDRLSGPPAKLLLAGEQRAAELVTIAAGDLRLQP